MVRGSATPWPCLLPCTLVLGWKLGSYAGRGVSYILERTVSCTEMRAWYEGGGGGGGEEG